MSRGLGDVVPFSLDGWHAALFNAAVGMGESVPMCNGIAGLLLLVFVAVVKLLALLLKSDMKLKTGPIESIMLNTLK